MAFQLIYIVCIDTHSIEVCIFFFLFSIARSSNCINNQFSFLSENYLKCQLIHDFLIIGQCFLQFSNIHQGVTIFQCLHIETLILCSQPDIRHKLLTLFFLFLFFFSFFFYRTGTLTQQKFITWSRRIKRNLFQN